MTNLAHSCHQSHPWSSSQPAQLPREHKAIAGHKDTARSCPQCSPRGAWGQGVGHRGAGTQELQGHGGGWGQVVAHRGIGTKAWGQIVRHRYRDTGKWDTGAGIWGWRDTGAGTQGCGSAGTQEHVETGCRDTRVQGRTGAGTCAAVLPLHPCIIAHLPVSLLMTWGNYELLLGSSLCPRNGIPWMGISQQSDGHIQPQNPALELLGNNCRC